MSEIGDVFYKVGEEAIQKLREGLAKSDASSKLSQSIDYQVKVFSNGSYEFTLTMEHYYQYVDKGRRPGKRPPVEPIEDWITNKGIDVKNYKPKKTHRESIKRPKKPIDAKRRAIKAKNTKSQTLKNRERLAFAIAMNIGAKGYKGNNFFSSVINQKWIEDLYKELQEAGARDLEFEFDLLISQ